MMKIYLQRRYLDVCGFVWKAFIVDEPDRERFIAPRGIAMHMHLMHPKNM